jgi:DNA-binding NtrC family response regulator
MNSKNVLVIDDEPVVGAGCRMVLMKEGHEVHICESGREGLIAALKDQYDIVILDLKLPDIDGMEILGTIMREKPQTSVIIITGYSTVQNAIQAMKLGAFDYLAKPFSDDELVLSVERAIEKKHLVEQNLSLRRQLSDTFGFSNIIGKNRRMMDLLEKIRKVAPTDCSVLINGENGTGKELVARAIHVASQQRGGKFVGIDCSTLSPSLLESELFGHVKGAFTGASRDKPGIFELAGDGTLFLDDIANLSQDIQGKLLRVLETREFKPVGGTSFKKVDARLISATNCDLQEMVEKGSFRQDLYYRLSVFPIFLPPLRERKDDIPLLANHYLTQFCDKTGKRIEGFTKEAMEALVSYEWPGNVRQLRNFVEHLVIMADRDTLDVLDLLENLNIKGFWREDTVPNTRQELLEVKKRILEQTFGQFEKLFLIRALDQCDWNITLAARKVGMKRPNFSALMKQYKISRSSDRPAPHTGQPHVIV